MLTFLQGLIDLALIIGLLVMAAAHLSQRTTSEELDEIRDYVEQETGKLWANMRAKMDGGTKPK